VEQIDLPVQAQKGTFVAPTIIELDRLSDLTQEVFGPVLHIIRFRRDGLDDLIEAINATGYGLTFGLHTRLDETIAHVTGRVKAGNLYINRNVIGAIVGVQPFGGRGLSGTGPKAGGPLYLGRLVSEPRHALAPVAAPDLLTDFARWLEDQGEADAVAKARAYGAASLLGHSSVLPGPVGERNLYALHPRGCILLCPATAMGLLEQMAAVLATGNKGCVEGMNLPVNLPPAIAARFTGSTRADCAAVLAQGDVAAIAQEVAAMPGPILSVHAAHQGYGLAWRMEWLLEEVSTSINTTAAGAMPA
jgi:RHH-type proline utilization regulon transcriptional repressor/proline dehydrogenase/delta 1-pyrroline-5-carboxylate dehydrogenase